MKEIKLILNLILVIVGIICFPLSLWDHKSEVALWVFIATIANIEILIKEILD